MRYLNFYSNASIQFETNYIYSALIAASRAQTNELSNEAQLPRFIM
jgi:hypothetical protein